MPHPALDLPGEQFKRSGREIEVVVRKNAAAMMDRLRALSPETMSTEALSLEEIYVNTLSPMGVTA